MNESTSQERIRNILYGFMASECIYVATALGLADHLSDCPRTVTELASLTSTHPEVLDRLMCALVRLGIFSKDDEGRFALTTLAIPLKQDADGSLRNEILHMLHPSSWITWGHLLESIRSGQASFPMLFGMNVWEYRAEHPEIGDIFDAMATSSSKSQSRIVLERLALPERGIVVDVGGGNGALLAEILSRRQELCGILFERPRALSMAGKVLGEAGVADRCRLVAGDFFHEVPPGGDLYILKAIIHNWNNEKAITILRNCRRVMQTHARIVIIESLLDPSRGPRKDFMDLHMLVIHGGRERTAREFESLLLASGFRLNEIQTSDGGQALIEGAPV